MKLGRFSRQGTNPEPPRSNGDIEDQGNPHVAISTKFRQAAVVDPSTHERLRG